MNAEYYRVTTTLSAGIDRREFLFRAAVAAAWAALPLTLKAQVKPRWFVELALALIALSIGAYMLWKMYEICSHCLPPTRPPVARPDPGTNAPPGHASRQALTPNTTQNYVRTLDIPETLMPGLAAKDGWVIDTASAEYLALADQLLDPDGNPFTHQAVTNVLTGRVGAPLTDLAATVNYWFNRAYCLVQHVDANGIEVAVAMLKDWTDSGKVNIWVTLPDATDRAFTCA